MRKRVFSCWFWIFLCHLLIPLVCSKNHGNPANDLVIIINNNRSALKIPELNNSPGLGCMALQYAAFCKGNCSTNNTVTCKPPQDDFTEVFAPNCGVELPTFGTLTGHIVGCQSKYMEPSLAFTSVIAKDKKALSLLRNKTHTAVGVGLVRFHKGQSFWCVLFSDGQSNSSFVLEDHGLGIKQKKGCFSGSNVACNRAEKSVSSSWCLNLVMFIAFLCIFLSH